MIYITALVVPVVCDPVCHQPVSLTQGTYDYLSRLDLADLSTSGADLDIDVLIGWDYYWMLVTERVLQNQDGPTAIYTRLGWIISGPTGPIDVMDQTHTFVNLISSHTLSQVLLKNWNREQIWTLDSRNSGTWNLWGSLRKNHLSTKYSSNASLLWTNAKGNSPWTTD